MEKDWRSTLRRIGDEFHDASKEYPDLRYGCLHHDMLGSIQERDFKEYLVGMFIEEWHAFLVRAVVGDRSLVHLGWHDQFGGMYILRPFFFTSRGESDSGFSYFSDLAQSATACVCAMTDKETPCPTSLDYRATRWMRLVQLLAPAIGRPYLELFDYKTRIEDDRLIFGNDYQFDCLIPDSHFESRWQSGVRARIKEVLAEVCKMRTAVLLLEPSVFRAGGVAIDMILDPPDAIEDEVAQIVGCDLSESPGFTSEPHLDCDHLSILRVLAKSSLAMIHEDIAAAVKRGRKTVGNRIQLLRIYGFVERAKGATGEIITDSGRQALAMLDGHKDDAQMTQE